MAIYLRVSSKTKEARRKLESIISADRKITGKDLLKKFLNVELKNQLSSKTSAQSIISYVESFGDSNINKFANLLLENAENQKKFKEAVKCQAYSTGTKKNSLFRKMIYQGGNLNFNEMNKSKIKAFLLAKKDSDIDENEDLGANEKRENVVEEEDKKSRRMKNKDIVAKLKSGRLSNILKVFMALVLWSYVKLNESKKERQKETEEEVIVEEAKEEKEIEEEEEVEEEFLKESAGKTFEKTIDLEKFQHKHKNKVPPEEGAARLQHSYKTNLLRDHLNEALEINKQGVQFNNGFFNDFEISKWRTIKKGTHGSVETNQIRRLIEGSNILKDLYFYAKSFTQKNNPGGEKEIKISFLDYIFGMPLADGGERSRVEVIKNTQAGAYHMLCDELKWISENEEFLNKKDETGEPYKERLKMSVYGLNNQCSTELVSLITSWSSTMDRLCQIQAGKKNISSHDDSSTIRKKILTNVRSHCLEKLAQEMIRVALPMDDTIKVDAEVQEVVHAQCAKALNVPEQGMNAEHVDILNDKFDLVYKTNALSSIMNIPAIAEEATEYIKLGKINKEVLEKDFDDTISYSLCCKILDRSARDKLKKDKRSFNKRFKKFMKFVNSKNFDDADSKEILNDWVYNKRSKKIIDDIFDILSFISLDYPFVRELLPEAFLDYNEIFGRLIFIKYLVDQKTITLKN